MLLQGCSHCLEALLSKLFNLPRGLDLKDTITFKRFCKVHVIEIRRWRLARPTLICCINSSRMDSQVLLLSYSAKQRDVDPLRVYCKCLAKTDCSCQDSC